MPPPPFMAASILVGPEGEPQPAGDLPAALSRETVQLCFSTRHQVAKLKHLELELLQAWHRLSSSGTAPTLPTGTAPSILRGCFVRFVSKGTYHIARVLECLEDPEGQLSLKLQGFERLVPATCLSNTNPLADKGAWEKQGRSEVEELARAAAAHLPSRREIAATCCRLSTAWLWAAQPEAFKAALQCGTSAVVAALEDPAAVAALLPCVQQTPHTASTAGAAAAGPGAAAGEAQAADIAAKRQRTDSPLAGAVSAAGAATKQQQQQQQEQQPSLMQQQQQQQSAAAPSWPPPPSLPPPTLLPPSPQQQQYGQQQRQQQQQAAPLLRVPVEAMPPGGVLETLVLRAVYAAASKAASSRLKPAGSPQPQWHTSHFCTLSALGQELRGLSRNWRALTLGYSLKQLVLELCVRGRLMEGRPEGLEMTCRLPPGIWSTMQCWDGGCR